MDSNQQAARQARRFLQETVRTDWVWPAVPIDPHAGSDAELQGVTEFRERFYGTPSESENDAALEATVVGKKTTKTSDEAYRFDSPDSVGVVVATRNEARMHKRRKALEEEMRWNEGLATFEKRRNCWTGAAAVAKKHAGTNTGLSSSSHPSTSSAVAEQLKTPIEQPPSLSSDSNLIAEPTAHSPSQDADSSSIVLLPNALTPIAPSLLSSNPIRSSIGPSLYPDIFSKVVLNGRTPSVPINLSDMTRALVQGWKDAGEWPPKPGPPDPLAGRRRKSSIGTVLKDLGGRNSDEPFLKNHPHVRKGVESVKKVFRMSGSQGSGSSNYSAAKEH